MTKLVDELTKRKVNKNTTLENQDVLRKDKEDNNDKVGIVRDVRLDGRESKQHKIALKPHKQAREAMEALASHLKRFLLGMVQVNAPFEQVPSVARPSGSSPRSVKLRV